MDVLGRRRAPDKNEFEVYVKQNNMLPIRFLAAAQLYIQLENGPRRL